jgi:hypothetical protein
MNYVFFHKPLIFNALLLNKDLRGDCLEGFTNFLGFF